MDYETAASYEFQIFATDGGGNNKKSASANIKVEIIDVNDNDPSFTNLPNKIYVPENKPAGKIYTVKVSAASFCAASMNLTSIKSFQDLQFSF